MYFNKIFLWLVNRILRVTLYKLFWSILLIIFIVTIFWNNDSENKLLDSKNPVIVWWTDGFPGYSDAIYCPSGSTCNVFNTRNISKIYKVRAYLFYGSNVYFDNLPLPRKPREVIWGLYHEESPRNVEEFMHEPVLKLFNFSSTFSRYSDVPFPLQHLHSFYDITNREYYVETSVKNGYLNEIAPILYIQSDCETSTERDSYVKELMEYIKVDSYGICLNNKVLPKKFTDDYLNNLNEDTFLKFVARYKFVVAIENGVCEDYVTEKFWRAIKVGSVPIYFGSPSINDWLPNTNSAILLQDYSTPKMLSDHINILLQNDDLYESYLEHKTQQIITNVKLAGEFDNRPYQLDSLETVEKFQCFVCDKIHEINKESSVVDKNHYNCPEPVSALNLKVNPSNSWVQSWETKMDRAKEIYRDVIGNV